MPSQPESFKIPAQAKVRVYTLRESQGILWIWIADDTPPSEPPSYDFFEPKAGYRRVADKARLAAAPFTFVVENALDNSHPPFIHPETLPTEPQIVERQIVELDDDGRGYSGKFDPHSPWRGRVDHGPRWAALLSPLKRLTSRKILASFFRFELGGVVYFYDDFGARHRHVGFACITPADDTHTWFFAEIARTYWSNSLIDVALRWWMARLNREDVVESEKLLAAHMPGGLPNPVHVVADLPSVSFRKLYRKAVAREAGPGTDSAASSLTAGHGSRARARKPSGAAARGQGATS